MNVLGFSIQDHLRPNRSSMRYFLHSENAPVCPVFPLHSTVSPGFSPGCLAPFRRLFQFQQLLFPVKQTTGKQRTSLALMKTASDGEGKCLRC